MRLLIDGYNLLYQSNMPSRNSGINWLAQARARLVSTLAQQLAPEWQQGAVVVFDAKDAPKGLPATQRVGAIEVLFARDHAEADDLLEELIERSSSPERLLVVSSDRRIQKAAKRRRAAVCDSDLWYDRLLEGFYRNPLPQATNPTSEIASAASSPIASEDVRNWLVLFQLPASGPHEALPTSPDSESQTTGNTSKPQSEAKLDLSSGRPRQPPAPELGSDRSSRLLDGDVSNPFPQGYGEDLED